MNRGAYVQTDWEKFSTLPTPSSIEAWCCECIIASFPADKGQMIYWDSLQYLGWLNNLPIVEA